MDLFASILEVMALLNTILSIPLASARDLSPLHRLKSLDIPLAFIPFLPLISSLANRWASLDPTRAPSPAASLAPPSLSWAVSMKHAALSCINRAKSASRPAILSSRPALEASTASSCDLSPARSDSAASSSGDPAPDPGASSVEGEVDFLLPLSTFLSRALILFFSCLAACAHSVVSAWVSFSESLSSSSCSQASISSSIHTWRLLSSLRSGARALGCSSGTSSPSLDLPLAPESDEVLPESFLESSLSLFLCFAHSSVFLLRA